MIEEMLKDTETYDQGVKLEYKPKPVPELDFWVSSINNIHISTMHINMNNIHIIGISTMHKHE